ncbi:MAG: HAMP domain-containing protein [Chloroflexales bacterium]|nr:HAMP domain-containing protein [Chloroflexales bacterium]
MRQILQAIRSQIQYTIILPYLALTVVVMLAGASLALLLVSRDLQERFDNQLLQVHAITRESLSNHEQSNLSFLYQVAFAPENTNTNTPPVATAIATRDVANLKKALSPYYQYNIRRGDWVFDRLIAVDTSGKALVDWQRDDKDPNNKRIESTDTDLSGVELVQRVLRGEQNGDVDKFSALIEFLSSKDHFYFTVVPVRSGDKIVGGLIVAARLNRLMGSLQQQSQSVVTAFYAPNGLTLATTLEPATPGTDPEVLIVPTGGLKELDIPKNTLDLLASNDSNDRPTLMTVPINNREYQFFYSTLRVGNQQVGYYSVALARRYVVNPILVTRWGIIGIAGALAVGIVLLGYVISRRITRPLQSLVRTAEAVTQGKLEQRSEIASVGNEFGTLAQAFNQMTEHLLRLYHTSRDLNQTLDIAGVLDVTSSATQSFVPGTAALALLAEPDGWCYRVGKHAAAPLSTLSNRIAAANPADLAVLSAEALDKPLIIESVPALQPELGERAQQGSALLTRLVVQDQFLGLLLFVHPDVNAFSENNLPSLRAVANMAVSVLHNAALYTRVQRDASERQAILESIADGVVVCDNHQQIVMANQAAIALLQLHNWQNQPIRLRDLPLQRVAANGELFGNDKGSEHYQLGEQTLALSRAPVVGDDSMTLGEVIVLHDLSDEVALSQAKTAFIATISHELRTPLTPIFMNLDLLLRGLGGPLNEDQSDIIKQVRKRASDINDIAQKATLIASIESNVLTIDLRPQDIHVAVDAALTPLLPSFNAKGITVRKALPADLPPVLADRELLTLTFSQLLDNARRFTQQGEVTISAHTVDGQLQVDIADTGIGISPEAQELLFRRFQRVEGNSSPERGGGLGLAITRQVVERQGGRVWVSSTLGQGSVFSFVLPYADEHAIALAQSDSIATT